MLIADAAVVVLFVIVICAIERGHANWKRDQQERREEWGRHYAEYERWCADPYGDTEDD